MNLYSRILCTLFVPSLLCSASLFAEDGKTASAAPGVSSPANKTPVIVTCFEIGASKDDIKKILEQGKSKKKDSKTDDDGAELIIYEGNPVMEQAASTHLRFFKDRLMSVTIHFGSAFQKQLEVMFEYDYGPFKKKTGPDKIEYSVSNKNGVTFMMYFQKEFFCLSAFSDELEKAYNAQRKPKKTK